MAGSVRGQFLWHELMTGEPRGAVSFYQKIANWTGRPSEHDPSYTEMVAGTAAVAGITTVPAVARAGGVKPGWLVYIGTDDAEVAAWEAQRLGGKVIRNTESIPGIGKFATLRDPYGAVFAVLEPAYQASVKWPVPVGQFSWHELATRDREGALRFYSALFGWQKTGASDMGAPVGVYQMYGWKGKNLGGMYTAPPEMGPSRWVSYIKVANTAKAATAARKLGATIVFGPMEVPGGDQVAAATDPQQVEFAVHSVKARPAAGRKRPAKKAAKKKAPKKKGLPRKTAGRKKPAARRKAKRR